MGTPEVLEKLFGKLDLLTDKVSETNLILERQNGRINLLDEKKADKVYVDDKISMCSTSHKKTSIAPAALTPKQKQLLVNAIVAMGTAAAAFLTAKFGI